MQGLMVGKVATIGEMSRNYCGLYYDERGGTASHHAPSPVNREIRRCGDHVEMTRELLIESRVREVDGSERDVTAEDIY